MHLINAINLIMYGGNKPEQVSVWRWNAIVVHVKKEYLECGKRCPICERRLEDCPPGCS